MHTLCRQALTMGALALVLAPAADGQDRFHVDAGGILARVNLLTRIEGSESREDGTMFGIEALGRWRRWLVSLEYQQGSVKADVENAVSRDVVLLELLLGIQSTDWLAFVTGPYIRSYTTSAGTEQLFQWEVRGQVDYELLPSVAWTYLDLWIALFGSINVGEDYDGGRGGEIGIRANLPDTRWWGRLSYRIEQADLTQNTRSEIFESLRLTVEFAIR